MKKILGVFLFTLLVVNLVALIVFTGGNNSSIPKGANNFQGVVQNVTGNAVSAAAKISLSELGKHNSGDDCWVSYKGKVYDITSFLPVHPGSAEAIIPYCGTSTEFEKAFTNQHGTSKVKTLENMGIYKGELQ